MILCNKLVFRLRIFIDCIRKDERVQEKVSKFSNFDVKMTRAFLFYLKIIRIDQGRFYRKSESSMEVKRSHSVYETEYRLLVPLILNYLENWISFLSQHV
jgi:hypothetical protein